jgi:CBS-domain-containing membrane protein
MTAADLMRRDVVTVPRSASLKELTKLLRHHDVSGVPVVDDDGSVVGTVSVSDLIWQSDTIPLDHDALERTSTDWARRTVEEVMTPDVFGVAPDASLGELAGFFARTGLRRAIVLEGGEVVGIVSALDLLGTIADRARDG